MSTRIKRKSKFTADGSRTSCTPPYDVPFEPTQELEESRETRTSQALELMRESDPPRESEPRNESEAAWEQLFENWYVMIMAVTRWHTVFGKW